MKLYIYENEAWPDFRWDSEKLLPLLGSVRNLQGRIIGKMEALGFELRDETSLSTLTLDVSKSSEIEGEMLNAGQVRSSIARRLGMNIAGLIPSDRTVDGVVEMMLDATQNFEHPLTKERLIGWHCALFPAGRSGLQKIITGNYRNDASGPMQVVSGAFGRERVHFQAPAAECLESQMHLFLNWINSQNIAEPIIKAGIAHLWFITLHPFEDGNGRMARAITDMLLTRADGIPRRFYSMSAQICIQRKEYYAILEKTQKGSLDITAWLEWFSDCLLNALLSAETALRKVMAKHDFWQKNAARILNERQRLMLNMLLDDFKGKLTSSKWAALTKCSQDTALRDIHDLVSKGILRKSESGGRSTSYSL